MISAFLGCLFFLGSPAQAAGGDLLVTAGGGYWWTDQNENLGSTPLGVFRIGHGLGLGAWCFILGEGTRPSRGDREGEGTEVNAPEEGLRHGNLSPMGVEGWSACKDDRERIASRSSGVGYHP